MSEKALIGAIDVTKVAAASSAQQVPCALCPLRPLPHFRDFQPEELRFVQSFKQGELVAAAGSTILEQGMHSAHLFTLLSGWAFRYKTLPDGRRQVLNYLFPGDLVGLQGTVVGEMDHTVEALTPLLLCVFQRDRLAELYQNHAGLAFDITWLAAREERILDDHLLSVGRRTALERAAYLIVFLHQRAQTSFPDRVMPIEIPITQQHLADTLGLSIVHTNKTLRKLINLGLIRWQGRSCTVLNEEELLRIAGWEGLEETKRPFI